MQASHHEGGPLWLTDNDDLCLLVLVFLDGCAFLFDVRVSVCLTARSTPALDSFQGFRYKLLGGQIKNVLQHRHS